MKIEKNSVVNIHYTLTDDNGAVLDSSEGRDPLAYLHGVGQLIPGLENTLTGMVAGDSKKVVVAPKDGYGEFDNQLVAQVSKDGFRGEEELVVGMKVQVDTNEGQKIASIDKIEGDKVTLNLNHPLAGKNLNFAVEIVEVREATDEEISHGHVHGPGGHQH